MADRVAPEVRSRMMRQIKSRDTKPELAVRRSLHEMGYRFTAICKSLPGKPDICFSKRKHVVFVHGCFWHRHRECPRGAKRNSVASNIEFWVDKFRKNIARDKRNAQALRDMGWKVHVVWECEVADRGKILKLASALGPPRWT